MRVNLSAEDKHDDPFIADKSIRVLM